MGRNREEKEEEKGRGAQHKERWIRRWQFSGGREEKSFLKISLLCFKLTELF